MCSSDLAIPVTYADGSDLAAAANLARAADAAIVFVQTDESEGSDRPNLGLPGNQDRIVAAVAAVNKNTIVVLNTGGPVLMPWVNQVSGLLEAWYPGQEDGNAIASILYGEVNPSAKLPLTFPRTAIDLPTSKPEQWPGTNGQSEYSEKLNVGYRWYDATGTEPLFPFGFGLSYTKFQLSHLAVSPARLTSKPGSPLREVAVEVRVSNTGERDGSEVVQVYVGQPPSNGEPPHQLRAFARIQLKRGETKPLRLILDEHSFSIYDVSTRQWISPSGTYQLLVGTSSRDVPLRASIVIGSAEAR